MLARQKAIAILTKSSQGAKWTKHCFAVADVSVRVGLSLEPHRAVDCAFLWSAALERRFVSLRRRNADNAYFLERLDRAFGAATSFMAQIEQDIGGSVERIVALQDQPS
jgi:hypothetical protein